MSCREIDVGDVPVRALRVTYVGELGWELYCPAEFGAALWRTLWEAGGPHGFVAGGYRAIDSLRLEKGYRVWGADITPDVDPFQGGLGFAVKLDKGEFIGREALLRSREDGNGPRLCCLVLDDPRAVALANEPVMVDGQVLGRVTSGGYGYTVERSIAYAYLRRARAPGTEVAVEIFGEWARGRVALRAALRPGRRARARLRRREQAVERRGAVRAVRRAVALDGVGEVLEQRAAGVEGGALAQGGVAVAVHGERGVERQRADVAQDQAEVVGGIDDGCIAASRSPRSR